MVRVPGGREATRFPETSDEVKRWIDAGAILKPVATSNGQVDPAAALRALGQAGITRVFCEGGGMLAASLLAHGLVDELIQFTAGMAIGAEGQPGIGALGVEELADAPRMRLTEVRDFGGDVMQRWMADR